MHIEPTLRLIAFYLPQFHPIPENDEWWGRGFTEWTNVAKARPLFRGHYQPHLPAELGFYDLRLPEVREAQANLATEYGIHGFCYYHYWFNGHRLLERPFNEVLASGKPDFPFCLCWANENWTKTWDGHSDHVLQPQSHSHEDDLAHIKSLIPALRDERYIRVSGKPLLLIYRTELLPRPSWTAEIWRDEVARAGIGDLYLARVESFQAGIDPRSIGFDAAVEFAPDWRNMGRPKFHWRRYFLLGRAGIIARGYIENRVISYQSVIDHMVTKSQPTYLTFRGVTPSWDNSPRRSKGALVLHGSTPQKYEDWLRKVVEKTVRRFKGEERLVFINAWNEWGEGCHLEPCLRWGKAYLEATRNAVRTAGRNR